LLYACSRAAGSQPNEHGVLPARQRGTLAQRGRSYAAITLALCDDGLYRYGLDVMYSLGGFGVPISATSQGFPTMDAARTAAIEYLLRHWHRPIPSDPASVRDELQALREQVEQHLRQPSLF